MNQKTRNLSIIALCMIVIAGGIIRLNQKKEPTPPVAENSPRMENTRVSDRQSSIPTISSTRRTERPVSADEEAIIERDKMTAVWRQNASTGFQNTQKNLIADLNLSEGESVEVEKIFARRNRELAALLSNMTSVEAGNDKETFRKITGLLRNKGLRDDLAGVLTNEQLATFDAKEAKREHETVLARAYSDMADINTVVRLTDAQKPEVLETLMRQAAEKVEHEADTRAFMTLAYGSLANELESANIRGLTNFVHEGLMKEGPAPDIEYESVEYGNIVLERKAQRIENDIASLSDVLDEAQLTRYREHLEKEPAW